MNRGWRDAVAAVLAVEFAVIGLWAVAAPRSFYESFPGAGRAWVAVDGPYNEHLTRDVGAFFAAFAVLCGYAVVNRTAPAVRAAGLAVAVFSAPHTVYHVATADLLAVGDAIVNVVALSLALALGLVLAVSPGPRVAQGDEPGGAMNTDIGTVSASSSTSASSTSRGRS